MALAKAVERSVVELGEPTTWSIAVGYLLVQSRDPVQDALPGLVLVLAAQVAVIKFGLRWRRHAAAASVAVQLVACATGVSPTIGIGAVVVCIAGLHEQRRAERKVRLTIAGAETSALVFLAIAAVAFIPWGLDLRAGAVLEGAARAHSPWDTALLLLFAVGVRANWNVIDMLLRGARSQVEEAQAARDEAAAAERSRIARELHDVVAHQMSVVVAQAQGAEAVAERDPTRARQALDTIARTTREALEEMRRLVAIDRPEGITVEAAGGAPMPGLGVEELAQLADNAEAAGLDVRVTIEMKRGTTVPPGVALSAHRAVQEALTNAAKHAPGSCVEVQLRQGESTLEVDVTNGPGQARPMDIPGSGVGLVGMRERVDFYGGTLAAGPTADGGWSVVATFPTLEAPPSSE